MLMDEADRQADRREGHLAEHAAAPRETGRRAFRWVRSSEPRRIEVLAGIARTYELAKKYKIKTAWGTDVLFSRALAQQQGAILASLARWYTPAEALVMATATNAELLALSGKRNPYPGKLGVVEQGALADLLLVDGNPLDNIKLIADPAKNFRRHHEGYRCQARCWATTSTRPSGRPGWRTCSCRRTCSSGR